MRHVGVAPNCLESRPYLLLSRAGRARMLLCGALSRVLALFFAVSLGRACRVVSVPARGCRRGGGQFPAGPCVSKA